MKETLLQNDCFHLEIDGTSTGGFLRCRGLEAVVDVFEYMEGGANECRRFAGDRVYSNIVLERGLVRDRELYDWFLSGERRDGSVVLLTRDGHEQMRWNFVRAWPWRWRGPVLDAAAADVAVESIEIVHEGLECLLNR